MGRASRFGIGFILLVSLACLALAPSRAAAQTSLQFDGTNDYVTFGSAASLGASTFTIETRFKRTAAGVTASTGTGGVTAVPLLSKGRGEADGDNRDMNYFLGVDAAGHLVVDYEEGAGQTSPGLNHPLTGASTVANGVWHHAAATFDGTTLRLYLDGILDGTLIVGAGRLPQASSIQHAALGSALTSAGAAAGFLAGLLDEARVWNVARSESEIAAGQNAEILAAAGLLGRWGMNEGTGTNLGNSVASGVNGTATNGPVWSVDSTVPLAAAAGLRFGGTNAYANFGDPAALRLAAFTVEMWIRRDGAGVGTSTGTGGVPDAVPLLAKGRAEAETATQDINYLLGIRASDGVLCADFEEGQGGPSPSLNHPVAGATPIPAGTGAWHHVAATYDGTTWTLYLDGAVDATLAVGRPLAATSVSPVAIASALTSTGAAAGFFAGAVDEVRIWSTARTPAEIVASMNEEITAPAAGLVARWGMNEDAGLVLTSSSGEPIPGTISGSNWSWGAGAPFDAAPPAPPADPTGLTAAAVSSSAIELAWTDNAGNETSYEVERSTAGPGGPFAFRASLPAGAVAWTDPGLEPSTEYCYRVRALNASGASGYAGPACATTQAPPPPASLDLGGSAHVSFGDPAALDLAVFTVECWFRRDGVGVTTTTGSGGIPDAIPLVTHGAPEADGSNVDMNFFLGIRNSDGVLCADFEEGAAGASPGLNHPVAGVTPVPPGSGWHHAAATYDGTTWTLYLNGLAETTLAVGRPVQSSSIQHAALGSALESTGATNGFFDGALDEVRIWSIARSAAEIQSSVNAQIASAAPGLAARWSLDEGAGTAVGGSAGTAVGGSIVGTGHAWDAPAPFDVVFTAPAAPTGLAATSGSSTQVDLAWTDASNNETSFEIERSTTGGAGPYAPLATVGPNTESYADTDVSPLSEYCYRVRAANAFGTSNAAGPACATTPEAASLGLSFGGSTYVTFGDPAALDLAAFTIECWFRRDGAGTIVSTGSGGVTDAIPLVTHGTSQADGSAVDMNFFLGIKNSGGLLCADFEEGAGGTTPGLNHPIVGTTAIANGVWHHAAATYDGTTWNLYLDGNLEGTLAVGQPVQSATTQHAALASSITSTGTAQGYFAGVLDEVRIWDAARTQAEIQGTANAKLTAPATGLVARWALEEGAGTTVAGSAGTAITGTITGANYAWVAGAPFDLSLNLPPGAPALVAPPDGATNVATSPILSVTASDPDGQPLTIEFLGREAGTAAGSDFTIVMIPDTQYYTSELNGATNAMLLAQTNWIVANRASRNVAYVATVGDCVEHGDNGGNDIEWQRANTSYSVLEDPAGTGLPEGLPYGITVGNHDQSPN
ncbi:MAG TPA: LamG-like jellyroll fold domain-containing protein, partial [Candidatus Eisenbacteria bacterium]|nr:LamG-like jellyroll fold domain-containing protein [Candidatus Eisenbacteria bacterium]